MYLPILPLFTILALPTLLLAATPQAPLHTATLHHLPPSSTPTPLALLTYNPTSPSLSTLTSFTPPPNTTDTLALTQIGIYFPNSDPKSSHYRTSGTATNSFHAPYKGRFRIVVEPATGEVLGASWRAWLPRDKGVEGVGKAGKETGGNGRGDFDIVTVKKAPPVVFDKPAKGKGAAAPAGQAAGAGVEGEEEVQEKTFLQKYWWLLIGVAVLAMTGGGAEK